MTAISRRALLALAAGAPAAFAQDANGYPNRVVKIIVPYPPGGFNDTLSRLVAARFHHAFKQPALVENRSGGGTVIVPLLIFWFAYGERLATGTSLAAIVLIGLLGALAQGGIYGNVHLVTGLLLAIPAVGGVILGTAIQQRIPQRAVSYLFAALLVAIAIELILK